MSYRHFKTIVSKINFIAATVFLPCKRCPFVQTVVSPVAQSLFFSRLSLVILLSSTDQASTPQILIKRCPLPSLPNIDLLHHHASSVTPDLFSTQGRQNHLKWLSFSLPQCAQFSRPSPAAFCLSVLPFACLFSFSILAFLPSGFQFTPALSRECFLSILQDQALFTFKSQFKGLF